MADDKKPVLKTEEMLDVIPESQFASTVIKHACKVEKKEDDECEDGSAD